MGAAVIRKKLQKAGITDIKVFHISASNLPQECQVIVTRQSLAERVLAVQPDVYCVAIQDYLNAPEYETLIKNIQESRSSC